MNWTKNGINKIVMVIYVLKGKHNYWCTRAHNYVHGELLVVGGVDSKLLNTASRVVYIYDSTIDSWRVISHISIPRSSCFAAILPDNQLIVVGGVNSRTSTIRFCGAGYIYMIVMMHSLYLLLGHANLISCSTDPTDPIFC